MEIKVKEIKLWRVFFKECILNGIKKEDLIRELGWNTHREEEYQLAINQKGNLEPLEET